jgi:hypothetical protein
MAAPRVVSPLIRTATGRIDSVRDAFSVDAAGRIKPSGSARPTTKRPSPPEAVIDALARFLPAEIDVP